MSSAQGHLRVPGDIRAETYLTIAMPSRLLCPILAIRAHGPM